MIRQTNIARVKGAAIAVVVLGGMIAAATIGCGSERKEPLRLEGNLLTVDNQTSQDWNDVQIYLNGYFRVSYPMIRANSRFQAPLDVFVAGFGQRFDFRRMQIRSLKLTATLPDGKPLELNKPFAESGLAGALGGKKK